MAGKTLYDLFPWVLRDANFVGLKGCMVTCDCLILYNGCVDHMHGYTIWSLSTQQLFAVV